VEPKPGLLLTNQEEDSIIGKITSNRGTNFNLGTVYQINGVPATTGVTLLFTVKSEVDDDASDTTNVVVKKRITMSGSSNVIPLIPTDIGMTWDNGNYVYDIKVIDSVLGLQLADSGQFKLSVTATNSVA
jgi:hypothetical protein